MVLMVVGAGRGPLVRASMRASARAGVPLRVYAVEKNPNAVVHIQQVGRGRWAGVGRGLWLSCGRAMLGSGAWGGSDGVWRGERRRGVRGGGG